MGRSLQQAGYQRRAVAIEQGRHARVPRQAEGMGRAAVPARVAMNGTDALGQALGKPVGIFRHSRIGIGDDHAFAPRIHHHGGNGGLPAGEDAHEAAIHPLLRQAAYNLGAGHVLPEAGGEHRLAPSRATATAALAATPPPTTTRLRARYFSGREGIASTA